MHTGSSEEITQVKDIFRHAGAEDICTTGEWLVLEEVLKLISRSLSLLSGIVTVPGLRGDARCARGIFASGGRQLLRMSFLTHSWPFR